MLKKILVIFFCLLFIFTNLVIGLDNFRSQNENLVFFSINNLGLVGHWQFDEISGLVAKDLKNNNDGYVNGAIFKKGFLKNGLEFDGDWDYVIVQDNPLLNFDDTNQLTIDLYVKWYGCSEISCRQGIIHKKNPDKSGYYLYVDENKIFFQIGDCNERIEVQSDVIETNKWYHVTAGWNGELIYIYLDDVIQETKVLQNFYIKGNNKVLEFGNNWGFSDNLKTFYGMIDEIRIFEKGLIPDQIPDLTPIEIESPTNEEKIKGIITIHGNVGYTEGDIKKVQVKIGDYEESEWDDATGFTGWSYVADVSNIHSGPLNIYTRLILIDNSIIEGSNVRVHVDNNNILPWVTINEPLPNQEIYDTIEIKGFYGDNDSKIKKIYIKIGNDNWIEAYLKNEINEWIYIFESNKYKDDSYEISVKCEDDEKNHLGLNYWSPTITITINVVNLKSQLYFKIPDDNYLHLFYDITRIKFYSPFDFGTIVLGKLTTEIEISENWDEVDEVRIFINDDPSSFRAIKSSDPQVWTCKSWMDWEGIKGNGLCNLKANAVNNTRGQSSFSEMCTFIYYPI